MVSAEHEGDRLVLVGHDDQHDDDDQHADHVPPGGDGVEQREQVDVEQVERRGAAR